MCRKCVFCATFCLLVPLSDVASRVDDIFVLPGVITSLCLDTVSARMGVGHLLLLVQLHGTHWAMICVIRRLSLTVSDVCLKLNCFQSTNTYSALEVSHFVRCINLRLPYLITYLCHPVRCSTLNNWTIWCPLLPYGYSCPVLNRVKSSFVIFDIGALWRPGLSVRVPRCQKLQMTV